MDNKTAMQEMVEWIEQRFNNPQETEVFKKATELLEKEKEQIIGAFEQGLEFGFPTNGSNYFNKTYNQNK